MTRPLSHDLIDAFRASITFRIVSWPADRQAEQALVSQRGARCFDHTGSFRRAMARGENAPIQLLVDASDANTAKLASAYASEITSAYKPA